MNNKEIDDVVYGVLMHGRISILLEEIIGILTDGNDQWNANFNSQEFDCVESRGLNVYKEKDVTAACFRLQAKGLIRIEPFDDRCAAHVFILTPHEIAQKKYESNTDTTA